MLYARIGPKSILRRSKIITTKVKGSPASPNSVSQRSHCSSSIDDLIQAKKKCIDVEMSHIKAARHASFISRHVREKRKFEAEDEARLRHRC